MATKSLFTLKAENATANSVEFTNDGTSTTFLLDNTQVLAGQQTAITDLAQDISATYVEAEVQAISDKVDTILAMLRTHGLIA